MKIVIGLLKVQAGIASKLNKMLLGVSLSKLKIGLLCFFVIGSTCSSIIIIRSILYNNPPSVFQQMGQIKTPKHFDKTGDHKQSYSYKDFEREQFRIVQLIKTYKDSVVWIDSLKRINRQK